MPFSKIGRIGQSEESVSKWKLAKANFLGNCHNSKSLRLIPHQPFTCHRLKYGRGEAEKSKDWVFGEMERFNPANAFMVVVPRKDAATVIPIIQKWILLGFIIYSDCWKAYNGLR